MCPQKMSCCLTACCSRWCATWVGIGEQRERLRAAGRHLKRGVLLYGPPGTGKTLTVRHLLARTPGTTAVLLTGPSIQFIGAATELARAMQLSIVVIEDIDLIAMDRDMYGPQPLLFSVLDALDGLSGDADVTFLMTTNRVELLERALAERPGRGDLAVEIPLPDAVARERLFHLYAQGLALSSAAIQAAAHRSAGVTASFAKGLMRRVVVNAAEAESDIADADLHAVLDDLLSARETLTRSLLGSGDDPSAHSSESPTDQAFSGG
jgi:ATP-dependent 26S proteasome regulatory subunit